VERLLAECEDRGNVKTRGAYEISYAPPLSFCYNKNYMDYKKILQRAVDLHVHVGPEIIPRKYTVPKLLQIERGKLRGLGVKNHFFPTISMNTSRTLNSTQPFVVNSITLNHYVGGFNKDAIRASAELSPRPIIVWFPTIHAENFLRQQKTEIPLEWIGVKPLATMKLRPANRIKGLSVWNEKHEISREVKMVLKTIKDYKAILATGHISWEESFVLVKYSMQEVGIHKVIITHPLYEKTDMPTDVQRELSELGAFVEHSFSMYTIDKIPIKRVVEQIKAVGAEHCILSSDVGQTFNKSPSEALEEFTRLLMGKGIEVKDIVKMLVENPNLLVC